MNASSRGSASETAPVSHPNFWKTWTSPPNANLARLTLGVFPLALASDFGDWVTHLAAAPDKHQQLVHKTVFKNMRFARYVLQWLYELVTLAQLPRAEELPD